MKIIKALFGIAAVLVIAIVLVLGYLGLIPGVSNLMGTNKPRDLGIIYTQADYNSARAKSKIAYEVLPSGTPASQSLQRSGQNNINTAWSSAEITSLMNGRPWKYWPYKDVQVKLNEDGSAEISGVLDKSKILNYAAAINLPTEVVKYAVNFLPADPVFYVKGRATLTENKVGLFEPQKVEIGRMPLPLGTLLSFAPSLIETAYAQSLQDFTADLSKVQDKKTYIINYINKRLASIPGFYAKSAEFGKDKLIFDGTLSAKESTAR
jgi:hypothetical protein